MMKSDPYLARIQSFNLKKGGGVTIKKVQNGYNLYLTATDAPIARLNPSGTDDEMRIRFWSYRGHWKDVGDFEGSSYPSRKLWTNSPQTRFSGRGREQILYKVELSYGDTVCSSTGNCVDSQAMCFNSSSTCQYSPPFSLLRNYRTS